MVVAGGNVWGVGERERGEGMEESKRVRGTTLGEKKNGKERRAREMREKEMLNFVSRQQRCLSELRRKG